MINNLISDQIKKCGLIWSYILKDMNFLFFRDFFGFFVNFSDFNSIDFELNSLIYIYIYISIAC